MNAMSFYRTECHASQDHSDDAKIFLEKISKRRRGYIRRDTFFAGDADGEGVVLCLATASSASLSGGMINPGSG